MSSGQALTGHIVRCLRLGPTWHLSVLLCVFFWFHGTNAQADSKPVTYLDEVWRALGPNHNVVLGDKTWKIFDNTGKVVFTRSTRMNRDYPLDRIGYAGDSLYARSLYYKPTRLKVTVLNTDGSESHVLDTQPLMRTYVARGQNLVFVCGNYVSASGKDIALNRVVAYSLDTGKEKKGKLPTDLSWTMKILSRPDWKTLFLITSGDWRKREDALTLIQYDKDLKQKFSHKISAKKQRLEFVCTTKDAIYAVVTTRDRKWTFVHFDVRAGKLSFPPFDVPRTPWLRGLVSGKNVVIWGEHHITFFDPKAPKTRRSISIPGSKTMRFRVTASAVADDGRFALVGTDPYGKKEILLVYLSEGKLLEQIEVKDGFLEHLKFVSDGKELLVFARKYTARVKLDAKQSSSKKSSTENSGVKKDEKKDRGTKNEE